MLQDICAVPVHLDQMLVLASAGNQAWPIGVTSIGIHERSSREKISHVMNTGGAAHIMNDEATRKYLQAMKRLLTVMQRLFPTDPSRCMDFDGYKSAERGAAGGGSDKLVCCFLAGEPPGQDGGARHERAACDKCAGVRPHRHADGPCVGLLQALLDAEARGDTWRDHGLSAAPHFLHEDGTVKVYFSVGGRGPTSCRIGWRCHAICMRPYMYSSL